MNQDYTDIIQRLSQLLCQAIAEREVNLSDGLEQLVVCQGNFAW